MDLMTTDEAAARLMVSQRRVLTLIEQGDLWAERVGRIHLVRADSVAEFATRRARGRALSVRMSWAALSSDLGRTGSDAVAAEWRLSRTERQRLLALRDRAVEDWSWLVRRRALTSRHAVRDAYVEHLLGDVRVMRSGISALAEHEVPLTAHIGEAEVYVSLDQRDQLLDDHMARADPGGRVIVHAVEAEVMGHVRGAGTSVMSAMTVGVDLAERADTRTRRAGYNLIGRVARG